MDRSRLWGIARLIAAAAIVAAIAGQLHKSIDFWHDAGIADVSSNVVSFFSFFTIDSNSASALVLVAVGLLALWRREEDPLLYGVRAAVTTYMVVTGIVYNLLLRNIELPQGMTLVWSNEILHLAAPLFLVADWLFGPGRRPLTRRAAWWTLAFPACWIAYTLLRGPHVDDGVLHRSYWYPYPFLNPHTSAGGYWSVAAYCVVIAVVVAVVALEIVRLSRRRSPIQEVH